MNISSESEKSRPTSFITVLQLAGTRFVAHDGFALAGYIAFVGILSLFPFLFFLAALFGFFGVTEPGTYFAAFLFHNIPEAVAESLETPLAEIFQNTYGNLLTISMLGALWTAGTGLEGVRTALNRALNVDRKRAYWRRRGQGAAILTVMAGGLTLTLMFAPYAWNMALEILDLSDELSLPWGLIQYAVSGLCFLSGTCVLYHFLPARRPTWRGVLPGAVLVLAASLAFSKMFGLFLSYFDTYTAVYGSLGGAILALLFFYYLGVFFIFGAEVNAIIDSRDQLKTD